jgi:hypothetical protein
MTTSRSLERRGAFTLACIMALSVGGTSRPSAFAVAVFIPQDRLQFCIGLTRL